MHHANGDLFPSTVLLANTAKSQAVRLISPSFNLTKPTTATSMRSRKKSRFFFVLCKKRRVKPQTLYCAPSKELAFCIIREMQELHPDWHFYAAFGPRETFTPLSYVAPVSALHISAPSSIDHSSATPADQGVSQLESRKHLQCVPSEPDERQRSRGQTLRVATS